MKDPRLGVPPIYVPGPNPFVGDLLRDTDVGGAELAESGPTHFAHGKNTYAYDAHTYHTKVPPGAIARYIEGHTHPNDVVLDPFCGSGTVGLACAALGRRAILSDLSPAASFIAYNLNTYVDPSSLIEAVDRVLDRTRSIADDLYRTKCRGCGQEVALEYVVWSYRVICPHCASEFQFWDVAQDRRRTVRESRLRSTVACPTCNGVSHKRVLRRTNPEPVLVGYYCCQSRGNSETTAPWSQHDEDLLRGLERRGIPLDLWYPTNDLPDGVNTRQPKPYGIRSVNSFYTFRNLWAMASLFDAIVGEPEPEIRHKLLFAFTGLYLRVTRFAEFRYWGGSSNSPRLYVPYVSNEQNVFVTFKRKARAIADHLRTGQFHGARTMRVGVQSALDLSQIPDESIDYCFTDPPFGANINYSEMNFLWESWLQAFTSTGDEAIVNKVRGRTVADYKILLRDAFREVRRVLRPDARFTVVFSSSSSDVWTATLEAILEAGFDIDQTAILEKRQPTVKQLTAPNVAGMDLVITSRRASRPTTRLGLIGLQGIPQLVAEVVGQTKPPVPIRLLFAHVIAAALRGGFAIGFDFEDFRRVIAEEYAELVQEPERPHSIAVIRQSIATDGTQLPLALAENQ